MQNEETISRILAVLSHPLRRAILLNLSEKGECSFTDIMNYLNIDTGKLSFHIRNLSGLIEQTSTGKYRLTKSGENAIRLVRDLENWAVEADVARGSVTLPFASFSKRAYAYLLDLGIIFTVYALAALLNIVVSFVAGGGSVGLDVNFIFFVVVFWAYSTILEGFAGQTIGKRIIGLSVIRLDSKRMSYEHAAVRNIGKIFVLLPFDLLIGRRLNDKNCMRYFDKFAGTTVIDLRQQST